jgi:hypothetical protein
MREAILGRMGRARAIEILLGSDDIDAATAERYGLVNRAIPDVDFNSYVVTFAQRIASFDKQALAAVKALLNRTDLPTPEDLVSGSAMFRQSVSWDGAKARITRLIKGGLSRPGDFELRLGHHLGALMASAPDNVDRVTVDKAIAMRQTRPSTNVAQDPALMKCWVTLVLLTSGRLAPGAVVPNKNAHVQISSRELPVPVGNLIRLASEAESRNVSIL